VCITDAACTEPAPVPIAVAERPSWTAGARAAVVSGAGTSRRRAMRAAVRAVFGMAVSPVGATGDRLRLGDPDPVPASVSFRAGKKNSAKR
jgi:hypothetical protein